MEINGNPFAAQLRWGLTASPMTYDPPVTDLSQSHVDAYAAKRRSGELGDKRRPVGVRAIRDGTARSELTWLASVSSISRGGEIAVPR